MSNVIHIHQTSCTKPVPCLIGAPMHLPLFLCGVQAGFPSPAEDYEDGPLDLNEKFIKRPAATYFARAIGHSMKGAGILDGALLIVDRSIPPVSGHIVIAVVNNEMTVKRLVKENDTYYLKPENPVYPALHFEEGDTMYVWGVVLHWLNSATIGR